MPRFFKTDFENAPFIEGDDAAHIAKSLRMRVGEELTVCNASGTDFNCKISNISQSRVDFEILSACPTSSEPTVKVTLFQCLPKSDKMDSVVKQSVELGVTEIVPVISSRCVSIPDQKAAVKKVERWQKIANEAAGQSGRGILPKVCEIISFKQLLGKISEFDKVLMFYENGGVSVASTNAKSGSCAIIIGSEGGFSQDEVDAAREKGATVCTLGKRILRTETAPLAALAAIMTLSGNMD